MSAATSAPAELLVARSRRVQHAGELLELLPSAEHVSSWVRHGAGLVGWGEVARTETAGAQRAADASAWWTDFCAHVHVEDDVGVPGSGPVAFTSLAFADSPGSSVLVVPRVVAGRWGEVTWVTELGARRAEEIAPVVAPVGLRYSADSHPVTRWRAAVETAVRRIHAGELDKVVLARDLLVDAAGTIDPRFVLTHLAARYPQCWTFAVDGLVGATPELLVRRVGAHVSSRVLAGTTWPREGVSERELATQLLSSGKDRGEHSYAVTSLVRALESLCEQVRVREVEVLQLRNVAHLSTTVTGELADPTTSVLQLAAALHPTAAVGGTPTDVAVALITELEEMDRGRYAGPVGWIDSRGDGELGLALRSAEVHGATARLFAGGGIVAESDPDEEVAETDAKFVPVRDALEGVTG
jgi:menaquinone-specific isochorismate synthase